MWRSVRATESRLRRDRMNRDDRVLASVHGYRDKQGTGARLVQALENLGVTDETTWADFGRTYGCSDLLRARGIGRKCVDLLLAELLPRDLTLRCGCAVRWGCLR